MSIRIKSTPLTSDREEIIFLGPERIKMDDEYWDRVDVLYMGFRHSRLTITELISECSIKT